MQSIKISKDVLALLQSTAQQQFGSKKPEKQVTFEKETKAVEGEAKKKKKSRQRVKKEKKSVPLSREQEIQRNYQTNQIDLWEMTVCQLGLENEGRVPQAKGAFTDILSLI